MVTSLLKLSGLDWPVPDYSTLCRRQKELVVSNSYRPSPNGLHLLVDSTSIKMLGEGERKTKKHGTDYRRQWRKVHLSIDAETLEIRAIAMTSNRVGNAPMLPELLAQIPADESIRLVSGDGVMTPKSAMRRLLHAGRMPSFPFARMTNPGKKTHWAHRPGTKLCAQPNIWAEPFGKNGVVIIAVAWWKLKCAPSSYWVSASWHVTLIYRAECRFALRS